MIKVTADQRRKENIMKFKVVLIVLSLMFVAAGCNKKPNQQVQDLNQAPVPISPEPTPPPGPTTFPNPVPTPTPTPAPVSTQPKTYEVFISDTAFAPDQLAIKKGDTVKFVNNSSKLRWPASAPHPTHTDYPEFDSRQAIATGSSWSFTFQKVGTWRYHDHLQPGLTGVIMVVE